MRCSIVQRLRLTNQRRVHQEQLYTLAKLEKSQSVRFEFKLKIPLLEVQSQLQNLPESQKILAF